MYIHRIIFQLHPQLCPTCPFHMQTCILACRIVCHMILICIFSILGELNACLDFTPVANCGMHPSQTQKHRKLINKNIVNYYQDATACNKHAGTLVHQNATPQRPQTRQYSTLRHTTLMPCTCKQTAHTHLNAPERRLMPRPATSMRGC